MKRSAALLLVAIGLAAGGCSTSPRRGAEDPAAIRAYQARLALLAPVDRWEITGRLAITDGHEGGSGSLRWVQDGVSLHMSFRGTLGQGSWRLEADGSGARLQLADGGRYTAPDVADLVQRQLGWKVPVEALSWWVRGLAAQSPWQERSIDAEGRLLRLKQSGWEVELDHYRDAGSASVPARLFARHGAYAVKLVVKDWRLGGPGSNGG